MHDFGYNFHILLIVGGIVLAVEFVVVLGGFAYLFWAMVTSGF